MAQPTQVYPPWLAPSAVVITDAAGAPVTTSTTILYLPPTYFGPSIPLGSLYIYGGSSEPATVVLPSPTPQTVTPTLGATTTTAITTTATPTTSVSIPTTSATPTTTSSIPTTLTSSISVSSTTSSVSLTSLTTTTSLSPTISPTSSATPSPTNGPTGSTGLSRGQLVGVIVASILGVIFLFVLALFFFLWYKGRRNRRQFTSVSPLDDDDYYIVPPGGRTPGEGSPRHSGEEADPFLQQRGAATAGETSAAGAAAGMAQVGGQGASRPGASSRVPPPVVNTGSSGSTDSNASGFGELLDRPSLGLLPSQPGPDTRLSGVSQVSSGTMDPMNQGHVVTDGQEQYRDGEYTGAYAYSQEPMVPPRLVEPDSTSAALLPALQPPRPPYLSHQSSFQDREEARVLTAQRVRAEDLAPRSPPQIEAGPSHRASSGSGLLESLGLGALANIGRRSWFKQFDSPRNSGAYAYSPTYDAEPLSEKDIETGRSALLSPDRPVGAPDSFGMRRAAPTGFFADGTRPISSTSGRSGGSAGTTYHDAPSSLPGTPTIAPLPRAVTPSEPAQPPVQISEPTWFSSPLAGPPAYEDPFTTSSPSPSHGRSSPPVFTIGSPEVDVLDMPAPTALNHFTSIASLKEMTTGSSSGSGVGTSTKGTPFPPPGLETIRPVASTGWGTTSSMTDVTASPPSFAVSGMGAEGQHHQQGQGQVLTQHAAGITIDVLEDAPPGAEQGWRSMSMARAGGGLASDAGRRGTFGLYVNVGPAFMSEQGSLHSMRSHFSPSSRSTGSAPASRHGAGSLNSTSSRPSAHSAASSAHSAAAHSLGRQGSINSDNRKRNGHGPMISPALSAFGIDMHGSSAGQRRAASGSSGSGGVSGSHSQSGSGSNGSHSHGHEPPLSPIIGSPPLAHTTTGLRGMASGSTMGTDAAAAADTSFGSSTLRAGPHSRNPSPGPSPLSATFPLSAPWVGGLDDAWQPAA